jgi:anaerobic selenocysteine-containing dehydrogenase
MAPVGPPEPVPPVEEDAFSGDFLLVAEPSSYRHRGIDISSKVGGLSELALEEGFRLHPGDIAKLGLKEGDIAAVAYDHGKAKVSGTFKADIECPPGVVYYTRPLVFGGLAHRSAWERLYRLRQNPIRVRVTRAEASK